MCVPRTTRSALGWVACVVATTAFSAVAAGQADGAEAAVLRGYYSGNGLLNRGMYDLAAQEYRRFLDDHPDHDKAALARYGLAVSLFRSGNYGSAVEQIELLGTPAEFEYTVEALMITGQSRLVLGDPTSAAHAFGQVLHKHSEHGLADDSAALQAEALYEAGRFEEVERPCRVLATRWPDSPHRERAELFGGLAQLARGLDAAAAERFEAMIAMYPDGNHTERVVLLRAQSLHRAEFVPEAVAGYRDVIRRAHDEFMPDAMYGLAVLLNMTRNHVEAGTLLEDLLQRYPDDDVVPAAQLMRGRVWFDVEDYESYVAIQTESALRHMASCHPYDTDKEEETSLRGSAEAVNKELTAELTERLHMAGIEIMEARLSHLAYAPEIAGAMLQRQQAEAIIAARSRIVDGAVGMVQMALQHLKDRGVVDLDEERRAAMVSNLLVVLCSERGTTPVVNTGTIYH